MCCGMHTYIHIYPHTYTYVHTHRSEDNPEMFSCMEKTRMYILRGTKPEGMCMVCVRIYIHTLTLIHSYTHTRTIIYSHNHVHTYVYYRTRT